MTIKEAADMKLEMKVERKSSELNVFYSFLAPCQHVVSLPLTNECCCFDEWGKIATWDNVDGEDLEDAWKL